MRILVMGTCGAGKTSFSKRLGKKFEIPVVSSDEILLDEFWERRSEDERERKLSFFKKNDSWIFEGAGARRILEERGMIFDYLILLDYPKRVVLRRIFDRFRAGRAEKTAYGKIRSLVNLVFYLVFYSSKRNLRFAESKRDEGVGVFVIRSDENLDRVWDFVKSDSNEIIIK